MIRVFLNVTESGDNKRMTDGKEMRNFLSETEVGKLYKSKCVHAYMRQ